MSRETDVWVVMKAWGEVGKDDETGGDDDPSYTKAEVQGGRSPFIDFPPGLRLVSLTSVAYQTAQQTLS